MKWPFINTLAIANYFPILIWYADQQPQRSSHAWLVKAWEKAMAKERFEMGEDVHLVIFGVFVEVQASAIRHITVLKLKLNFILVS